MPDQSGPKPPHHKATPLETALGRLNAHAAEHVVVGRIAPPPDDEDRPYWAWVREPRGAVIEIDEIEVMALRNAGAAAGTIPRCPACGEPADYGSPINVHSDFWNCAGDDGPFAYVQTEGPPG